MYLVDLIFMFRNIKWTRRYDLWVKIKELKFFISYEACRDIMLFTRFLFAYLYTYLPNAMSLFYLNTRKVLRISLIHPESLWYSFRRIDVNLTRATMERAINSLFQQFKLCHQLLCEIFVISVDKAIVPQTGYH